MRLRLVPAALAAVLLPAAVLPCAAVFEAAEVAHDESWLLDRPAEDVLRALVDFAGSCSGGCRDKALEALRIEVVPRERAGTDSVIWSELRAGAAVSWYSRVTILRGPAGLELSVRMLGGERAAFWAGVTGRPQAAPFDELETRFLLLEERTESGLVRTRVRYRTRAVLSGWNRGFEPVVRKVLADSAAELRRIAAGG